MRFNRAAKVAALPLLAMVLVVALVACQGPIGPKGDKGDTVTGGAGTDAPPGLDAAAVDTLVFNASAVSQTKMVPLAGAFTGGTGDLTYRISSAINIIRDVTYALTKSDDGAAVLSVTMPTVANEGVAEDMVILVEAKDSAKPPADDVAYISVRANDVPGMPTADTPLIVGTQAAESRKVGAAEEANYHSENNIKCALKNTCEVTLMATDANLRDILTWMIYVTDEDKDIVSASVTKGAGRLDGVVTITGLKDGMATVRVWAVDEGDVPENMADDSETPDMDESLPYPGQENGTDVVHTIMVTVDPAPTLSEDAIEAVTMDIGKTEIVGTVFDLNSENLGDPVITPVYPADQRIAEVVWDSTDSDIAGGRALHVIGRNSGTVSITVKVSEPTTEINQPHQYVEHTFTATVEQQQNS